MIKKLLIIILSLFLSSCWTEKEGQKTGVIVKVAKEGKLWGTYEGELIRGGFDDGSGSNGRIFYFSIGQTQNNNVIAALNAMDKNKPVLIQYHCERWVAPWRGEHNCFLDKVRSHDA